MRAFVINLDSATQRWANVQQELAPLGFEFERFSAIRKDPGWQGCRASHIAVLELALRQNLERVAVFEDDFERLASKDEIDAAMREMPDDFDVCMLAYPVWLSPGYTRVEGTQRWVRALGNLAWASAYIVHCRFMQTLHDCWLAHDDHVDVSWRPLQKQYKFLCAVPLLGRQAKDMSSITGIMSKPYRNIVLVVMPQVDDSQLFMFRRVRALNMPHAQRLAAALARSFDYVLCIGMPFRTVATFRTIAKWLEGEWGGYLRQKPPTNIVWLGNK